MYNPIHSDPPTGLSAVHRQQSPAMVRSKRGMPTNESWHREASQRMKLAGPQVRVDLDPSEASGSDQAMDVQARGADVARVAHPPLALPRSDMSYLRALLFEFRMGTARPRPTPGVSVDRSSFG